MALALYLRELRKIPLLSKDEEILLAREAASGGQLAREKLIRANLRFVVKVAKRYQDHGLSLSDLISEGNLGLLRAVEKFDVDRGYHFITYAVWWIRQSILKAICEKSRAIRLPPNRVSELAQINKLREQIEGNSDLEVVAEWIARKLNMRPRDVLNLINVSQRPVSLESPVGTDDSRLQDLIEDRKYRPPYDVVAANCLSEAVERTLQTLSEREADILRCRFGLAGRNPMTLKEIGDKYRVSKERIRQIERKAIRRLQHPTRSQFLRSYRAHD